MYLSYAAAHDAWSAWPLIGVSRGPKLIILLPSMFRSLGASVRSAAANSLLHGEFGLVSLRAGSRDGHSAIFRLRGSLRESQRSRLVLVGPQAF